MVLAPVCGVRWYERSGSSPSLESNSVAVLEVVYHVAVSWLHCCTTQYQPPLILSRFGVPLSLLVLALFTATHVYLLFVASPNTTP
jgi:hypothetical protein